MHRDLLLARLAEYATQHSAATERQTAARFETFVRSHGDCFERTSPTGHITGSAWILDRSGGRALLTHHRKLDIWVQLGGHSDGDPDTLAVALREAREESGLSVAPARLGAYHGNIFDLDIHRIPARRDEPAHDHYDVRFLLQAEDEQFTVSDESHDLRWVSATELGRLTQEESINRMAAKWSVLREGG